MSDLRHTQQLMAVKNRSVIFWDMNDSVITVQVSIMAFARGSSPRQCTPTVSSTPPGSCLD
jgi:hypothetical protein